MNRHVAGWVSFVGAAVSAVIVVVSLGSPHEVASGSAASLSNGIRPAVAQTQVESWQKASVEGASFITTARTLEPYLVRMKDGSLSLNAHEDVLNKLSAPDVQTVVAGLRVLNAKLAVGELQTNPSLGVFDPRMDLLTLQAGWTGFGRTWWGEYWCFNHQDLVNLSNYPNAPISAAVIAVIALIPGTNGVVAVFVAIYYGWMAWADHGRGSCLNYSWAGGPLWVTSQ